MKAGVVSALGFAATVQALSLEEQSASAANPIRKVVTMLQNLEKKVQEEAETEEKLFDKYMCYCKTGASDLEGSISADQNKITAVDSAIKEAVALKETLDADLKAHQADRAEAKATMEKATAVREKEAKAFAAYKAEADSNIA